MTKKIPRDPVETYNVGPIGDPWHPRKTTEGDTRLRARASRSPVPHGRTFADYYRERPTPKSERRRRRRNRMTRPRPRPIHSAI